MNTYARALILSTMTAVSLTQGCSCSDNDNTPPVVIDPPAGETFAVGGTAAKGILKSAIVQACPIVAMAPDCENPIAVGTTDATGTYSLNIPAANLGQAFVIRVTANADTRMVCDLAGVDSCGTGINFGDEYTPSASLKLDSLLPAATANAKANVSALTSIAAALAIEAIAAGDGSAASIAAAMVSSAAKVADRFGITGDITQLPIVDITNSAAVKAADANSLIYNTLSAAIVAAVRGDDATKSIEDAIAAFVTSYVAGGLTNNAATGSVTDLSEILSQVSSVLTAVAAQDSTIQISGVINQVTSDANDASNTPATDTGSQGTASTTANSTSLEKAKELVKVLGDLGGTVDLASLGDSDVGTEADAFDTQLQAAEMATSDGVEQAVEATAMVVDAMARAYDAYDENSELTSFTSDDGIVVSITAQTETDATTQVVNVVGVTLSVEQVLQVMMDETAASVAIDMSAVVSDLESTEEVSDAGVETNTAMGAVTISGTADAATATLTVKDGSQFMLGELMSVYQETDTSSSDALDVQDLDLKLNVMIAQKVTEYGADAVSFEGYLNVAVSMLTIDDTWSNADGVNTETSAVEVETLNFALWGTVSNSTGDKMKLSIAANGDGSGVTFSDLLTDGIDSSSDTESGESFAQLDVAVTFSANLAGVIGAVKASYTVERSSESESESKLSIRWPGHQLVLTSVNDDDDSTPETFTLTNQDNVTAIFVQDESGDWTGTISVDGVEQATVVNAVVTFSNGDVSSLDILE